MTYVVLYYVQEQELRSKGRMLAMVYMACLPLSAIYIYIYIIWLWVLW